MNTNDFYAGKSPFSIAKDALEVFTKKGSDTLNENTFMQIKSHYFKIFLFLNLLLLTISCANLKPIIYEYNTDIHALFQSKIDGLMTTLKIDDLKSHILFRS